MEIHILNYLTRYYSTVSSQSLPVSILIISNLHEKENILSKRDLLIKQVYIVFSLEYQW